MRPDLPTEILLDIFECFTFSSSGYVDFEGSHVGHIATSKLQTLRSICLVSKRFKDLAEPLLYQTYVKPNTVRYKRPPYAFERHDWTPRAKLFPKRSLQLFLCRISERPDLARCVRSISLGLWNPQPATSIDPAMSSFYAGHDLVRNPTLGSLQERWKNSLLAGSEDAEIALLLMLTPNVRDIWFSMPTFQNPLQHSFWFSKVFEQVLMGNALVHPFKHLSMAFAHHWGQEVVTVGPEFGFPLRPFVAMTRLPTMKTFDTIGELRVH